MKVLILLSFVAFAAATQRIVNGNDAVSMTDTPWQVSLQRQNSHFCGGSVISETFIMTACHCKLEELIDITVNLGSLDWTNPQQKIEMKEFTCHPNWMRLLIDYDYGIIEMQYPAVLNDNVQPIALPKIEYEAGTDALISGWGLTDGRGDTLPNILQWANTKLVDPDKCFEIMSRHLSPRMQCAGVKENTACNGDSGGPLAVKDAEGKYVLVGNTSYGIANCPQAANSVWSKNFVVLDWIFSVSGVAPQ